MNIRKESVWLDGVEYTRYPDSSMRNHVVYYAETGVQNPRSYHREVYKKHHGPIPAGFHVHHRDFNSLNNEPQNLEALPPMDHREVHRQFDPAYDEWCARQAKHLDRIRHLTKAWHASPEGLEWHRQHGVDTYAKRAFHDETCTVCGKVYQTQHVYTPDQKIRTCSRTCINKVGEAKRRLVTKECPVCGSEFQTRPSGKRVAKTCSPKCGGLLRRRSH